MIIFTFYNFQILIGGKKVGHYSYMWNPWGWWSKKEYKFMMEFGQWWGIDFFPSNLLNLT